MLAGKLILKYAPFSLYHKLRAIYRNLVKLVHVPFNEDKFKAFLSSELEIKKGDVVFIHSSIDKLNITFNPAKVLEKLLNAVGDEGTLLFPAWHFNYRAEEYLKRDLVFDVRKSPSALGLLSELARRHPRAIRSMHPTSSIVAIGRLAEQLTNTHHQSVYPCGESSPFYKMMEFNAKIVGLGVSTEFLSFVHCPEDVMKSKFPYNTRREETFSARVKDYHGDIIQVETLVAHPDIAKRNIPRFIKKSVSPKVAKDFKSHGSQFFVVKSLELFDVICEEAKKGRTIYSRKNEF